MENPAYLFARNRWTRWPLIAAVLALSLVVAPVLWVCGKVADLIGDRELLP